MTVLGLDLVSVLGLDLVGVLGLDLVSVLGLDAKGDTGAPQRHNGCRSTLPGAPTAPQRQPSCPSTSAVPAEATREEAGMRFEAESKSDTEPHTPQSHGYLAH